MTAHRFDEATTVDAVVTADPALNRVFNQLGIDTCCGGQRTLAQAAAESGIEVREVLAALGSGVAQAPAAPTRQRAAAPVPPTPVTARAAAARSAGFFIGSLLLALTFGTTLGAELLVRIVLRGDASLPAWIDGARVAHAYAQVFGFAALFVMGVGLHAVPRFENGELAAPQLLGPALWLQIGGVLAVAVGALVGAPVAGPAQVVGHAALVAAAVAFRRMIGRTLAAGGGPARLFERYLGAGCTWLVLAAGIGLAGAVRGSQAAQPAVWEAALWGFLGLWVMGMSLRILPVILGVTPTRGRAATVVFLGYQASLYVWVFAVAGEAWSSFPALRVLGGVGLAVFGVWFVAQLRIVGRGLGDAVGFEEGYGKFVVVAYGWLVVALVVAPAGSAVAVLTGRAVPHAVLDFGRHAVALGFMTQMVFGVAMRVVPVFTGAKLWSGGWRDVSFYLLNGAVIARALQAVAELPGWQSVGAYAVLSAPLGLAAFVAFAVNVVMTMGSRPRHDTGAGQPVYENDPVAAGFTGRLDT